MRAPEGPYVTMEQHAAAVRALRAWLREGGELVERLQGALGGAQSASVEEGGPEPATRA